ncbi:MAG: hypothetical protein J4G09_11380 [Proteobacteria bacterium]|nr:hypothetical protein [Pseudomonadota bacterium]
MSAQDDNLARRADAPAERAREGLNHYPETGLLEADLHPTRRHPAGNPDR